MGLRESRRQPQIPGNATPPPAATNTRAIDKDAIRGATSLTSFDELSPPTPPRRRAAIHEEAVPPTLLRNAPAVTVRTPD